jgi:hypothetical protein
VYGKLNGKYGIIAHETVVFTVHHFFKKIIIMIDNLIKENEKIILES